MKSPLEDYCICIRCGKRYTDGVHKLCDACRENHRQYYRSHKAEQSARCKAMRIRLRAKGRCVRCGKTAITGKSCCAECSAKVKRKNDKVPRKRYAESGLCIHCGKERAEGYKVCASCLASLRYRLAYGRQVKENNRKDKKE